MIDLTHKFTIKKDVPYHIPKMLIIWPLTGLPRDFMVENYFLPRDFLVTKKFMPRDFLDENK